MKKKYNNMPLSFLVFFILILTGCRQMSELEVDKSAGVNGGFEISKNDLPVNWLMYTPNTVPDSDFKIELDNQNFKEGKQSLKFEVKSCKDIGGWLSPGFTNQFHEAGSFKGEATYKVSFWMMNKGAKYRINAGGVAPLEGEMKTFLEDSINTNNWQFQEFSVKVPSEMELRLELNILKLGTFWIDDVRIEQL